MLRLPGHDAVLNVDLPGTTTRAIHTMSASNDPVVLKAITVEFFPFSRLRRNDVFDPAHDRLPTLLVIRSVASSRIQLKWILPAG